MNTVTIPWIYIAPLSSKGPLPLSPWPLTSQPPAEQEHEAEVQKGFHADSVVSGLCAWPGRGGGGRWPSLGVDLVLEDVGVEAVVGVLQHHDVHLPAACGAAAALPVALGAQGQRPRVLPLHQGFGDAVQLQFERDIAVGGQHSRQWLQQLIVHPPVAKALGEHGPVHLGVGTADEVIEDEEVVARFLPLLDEDLECKLAGVGQLYLQLRPLLPVQLEDVASLGLLGDGAIVSMQRSQDADALLHTEADGAAPIAGVDDGLRVGWLGDAHLLREPAGAHGLVQLSWQPDVHVCTVALERVLQHGAVDL